MKIDSTGIQKSDLTDYLAFWTNKLREKYGNDFVIKKEGFVDNIATSSSLTMLELESVIMFLAKQLNPYTAEGEFQDALYALIGLYREYATFTTVQRTITGQAGTVCLAGDIKFKNKLTDDIFVLNSDVVIGDSGKSKGTFKAIELGAIELPHEASLEIVNAPDGITSVSYTEGEDTEIVGSDYQDDAMFRERWMINQSQSGSATQGGIYAALLPLVNNNAKNLKVRQNRSEKIYDDLPLHTMEVIINTPESDETIANTIYDNLIDGVGLEGKIEVQKYDSVGTPVKIKFSRSTLIEISFKVVIVVLDGYYLTQVADQVQRAIFNNFSYQMGEKVVANDFYQYINSIEGVDYVSELKAQRESEGWKDYVDIKYNELPELSSLTKIQVSE